MKRNSRVIASVVAACLVGCTEHGGSPLSPSGSPGGVTPVTLTTIDVSGPDTVHIGETVQFSATGHYSDNTTRDVTREARWQADAPALEVQTTSPGQTVGRSSGQVTVKAIIGLKSSVKSGIIVVPPGTYRIQGTVRDAGTPLPGVTVVVASGPLGEKRVDVVDGTYVVYGVAGPTTVTASKDGYDTAAREVVVSNHENVDIDIVLRGTRRDVSGRYTLTVTAAEECSALPDYARTREYPAVVTQTGPLVEVNLEGTGFLTVDGRQLDHFSGTTDATSVRLELTLTPPDFYYRIQFPPVAQVTNQQYYGMYGAATMPISANRLEGALDGTITTSFANEPIRRCTSKDHRMVFTR